MFRGRRLDGADQAPRRGQHQGVFDHHQRHAALVQLGSQEPIRPANRAPSPLVWSGTQREPAGRILPACGALPLAHPCRSRNDGPSMRTADRSAAIGSTALPPSAGCPGSSATLHTICWTSMRRMPGVKINRSWALAHCGFATSDPASIRTFGEPLVWGSVLVEVQSVSRRCNLSLGVH